jgi:PAS domain S-box-containing protein
MTTDTIFIVDDEPAILRLLKATLLDAGYQAMIAQEGVSALQHIEQFKPDLILLDVMMPGLDGFEICRRLKANPQTQHIPVIFMTALEDTINEVKGFQLGAVDYIIKPFQAQMVLARIKTHLTIHKLQQRLRQQNDELEKRVQARTVELVKVNMALQEEIAERRRAEEGLWKTATRFRSLIEHASDIMAILNPDGLCQYVSPSASRILSYISADLVGRTIFEFVHPDDVTLVAETVTEALRRPGLALPEIEYRLRHRNGAWHTFAATFTNLLDNSAVNGLLVNCHDITERKQLEAQYRHSQKMEVIGQLAGGVAHDFNNILTVISGHCAFILDNLRQDDPLRADVERIKKSGERAASLTRQLLAFSRKQALKPQIVNLNTIVSQVEKMLQRLIGEDIALVITPAMRLGQVKADPGQIEQVMMNLVVNARDAMPQGGKLIIETANVELDQSYARQHLSVRAGPYVMLAVSDTGHGMDEATKARIFEPFFTTKEAERGTGLGLATVYGIINQSDGHIQVYSQPGQGATFKIYLPRIEKPEETVLSDQNLVESRQGSETILLVEDDVMVRNFACRVLREAGYTVLETSHGAEALQLCEWYTKPIHLLVTDVVMFSGISGPQLAKWLVTLQPEMRVLYISGYPDNALTQRGLLESETPFLSKPFTPGTFIHKVREVLDAAQQRSPNCQYEAI